MQNLTVPPAYCEIVVVYNLQYIHVKYVQRKLDEALIFGGGFLAGGEDKGVASQPSYMS